MDYRLKKAYEQVYLREDNTFTTTLGNIYDLVYENKTSASSEDLHALSLITGITDNADLNKLFNVYEAIKSNNDFKTKVQLNPGTPLTRAYDPSLIRNYTNLEQLLSNENFQGKPLIITHASKIRKLRTPKPVGQRILEWGPISSKHVLDLEAEIFKKKIITSKSLGLKCLVIFALYKSAPNKFELIPKMPPGIGAEMAQVEAFNKTLEGLDPVKLILPGDTPDGEPGSEVPGIFFNQASKVAGVGKADIALLNVQENNSKEVFWISFKEGSYIPPTENSNSVPSFQQWGSLGELYNSDAAIKKSVDLFLTKCVSQYQRKNFDSFDINSQKNELLKKMNEEGVDKIQTIEKKDFPHAKVAHIVRSGAAMFFDLFSEKDKQNKLQELALKAIYGDDFKSEGSQFSRENVNLVVETPVPLSFDFVRDVDDNVVAMKLKLVQNSHVIKNPKLPEHKQYLPCLYIRRSLEDRFRFFNLNTKQEEIIIAGRLLVYPIGRARKNDEVKYSITNK